MTDDNRDADIVEGALGTLEEESGSWVAGGRDLASRPNENSAPSEEPGEGQ